MLPRVILHNGVNVDGRMDWFTSEGDMGLYYELAALEARRYAVGQQHAARRILDGAHS